MICYRDMTFCTAPCSNATCERRLTAEVRAAAERWWPGTAPIAVSDFSPICKEFIGVSPRDTVERQQRATSDKGN